MPHGLNGLNTHGIAAAYAFGGSHSPHIGAVIQSRHCVVALSLQHLCRYGFAGHATCGGGHLRRAANLAAHEAGGKARGCGGGSSGDQGRSDKLIYDQRFTLMDVLAPTPI